MVCCSRGAVPPRVICTTRWTSYCTPAQRRGYKKQFSCRRVFSILHADGSL